MLETSVEDQNKGPERSADVSYPLGMSYIDAYLKQEGYETVLKDYSQWNAEEEIGDIIKTFTEFSPDIIGFSMMTMTRVSTYRALREIKKIKPSVKVLMGGMHPTMMYEQLLLNFPVDAVIIGEGEHTTAELADALLNGKSLSEIKGIAYLEEGKVIKTESRSLNEDLDALPFPSHAAFMELGRTEANMLTTRGCPFKCSFCSLHQITQRRFRTRSVDNILAEMEHIIRNFPQITKIGFQDDTFNLQNERVIELCQEIVKRGINKKLTFLCSMRLRPLSDEMLSWMVKAGFKEIKFGMETGSQSMLKSIHKGIDPESIINAFKICAPYQKDIRFVKYLMVGFPGETWDTIEETVQLVRRIHNEVQMDFFQANPLWIYPGIEVYDQMKAKGQISDDYWLTDKPCPRYTVEHSYEELKRMADYISFQGAVNHGYFYLTKLIFKKIKQNPRYQFGRVVRSGLGLKLLLKHKVAGKNTPIMEAGELSVNIGRPKVEIQPSNKLAILNN